MYLSWASQNKNLGGDRIFQWQKRSKMLKLPEAGKILQHKKHNMQQIFLPLWTWSHLGKSCPLDLWNESLQNSWLCWFTLHRSGATGLQIHCSKLCQKKSILLVTERSESLWLHHSFTNSCQCLSQREFSSALLLHRVQSKCAGPWVLPLWGLWEVPTCTNAL